MLICNGTFTYAVPNKPPGKYYCVDEVQSRSCTSALNTATQNGVPPRPHPLSRASLYLLNLGEIAPIVVTEMTWQSHSFAGAFHPVLIEGCFALRDKTIFDLVLSRKRLRPGGLRPGVVLNRMALEGVHHWISHGSSIRERAIPELYHPKATEGGGSCPLPGFHYWHT